MNQKSFNVIPVHFLILISMLLVFARPAWAGKYPYAEFQATVGHSVIEVLKKHNLPVAHDRDNHWFSISAIPGSYTIFLHRADEIPQQAVLDIVKLCMDFYEQRERKERFRIVVYRESKEEWRKSLPLGIGAMAGVKPYFELTIGRNEK